LLLICAVTGSLIYSSSKDDDSFSSGSADMSWRWANLTVQVAVTYGCFFAVTQQVAVTFGIVFAVTQQVAVTSGCGGGVCQVALTILGGAAAIAIRTATTMRGL
jgi:hypothetical protein